jgi:hypothetical protein
VTYLTAMRKLMNRRTVQRKLKTKLKFAQRFNFVKYPLRVFMEVNLSRPDRRKFHTVEMYFLRIACGYRLTDRVRNTTIRSSLKIYALGEGIQDYKYKWHSHLKNGLLKADSKR